MSRLPLDASPSEQVIPSLDDFGIGAFYEFIDVQVTPGIRYYYKVQDIPANGSAGEIAGPESAMIPPATTPVPDTATATTAPPTTAAPTSTSTPSPTTAPTTKPTVAPAVNFWADAETVKAGDCTWLQWQVDHVQAVFLDGAAVNGQGAQTVCPCEAETHVLHVDYSDGSSEDFPLQIAVTGSCGSGTTSSILATPTRRPTPKLAPTVAPATPTPQPSAVTLTARPTPTSRPVAITPTVKVTSTPKSDRYTYDGSDRDGVPAIGPVRVGYADNADTGPRCHGGGECHPLAPGVWMAAPGGCGRDRACRWGRLALEARVIRRRLSGVGLLLAVLLLAAAGCGALSGRGPLRWLTTLPRSPRPGCSPFDPTGPGGSVRPGGPALGSIYLKSRLTPYGFSGMVCLCLCFGSHLPRGSARSS